MIRILCCGILVVLGLALFLWRDLAFGIAGYRPLGTPDVAALDGAAELDERDAPRFFAERNKIEVTVPRDMTVAEFLRLYQLELQHVREQIAAQDGVDVLGDDHVLRQGKRYQLTLTPPERGVP